MVVVLFHDNLDAVVSKSWSELQMALKRLRANSARAESENTFPLSVVTRLM
jgi:hypothetical protein